MSCIDTLTLTMVPEVASGLDKKTHCSPFHIKSTSLAGVLEGVAAHKATPSVRRDPRVRRATLNRSDRVLLFKGDGEHHCEPAGGTPRLIG